MICLPMSGSCSVPELLIFQKYVSEVFLLFKVVKVVRYVTQVKELI